MSDGAGAIVPVFAAGVVAVESEELLNKRHRNKARKKEKKVHKVKKKRKLESVI